MAKSLLILRFPYETASGMGGVENHVFTLTQFLQDQKHQVFFSSSCNCLIPLFKKHNFNYQKIWGGLDIVSVKALLIFPFTALFVFIRLSIHLIYYRFIKNVRNLYCLTLIEKILITPVARLLGMKVFWGEHTVPRKWLKKNPFKFLYLWWSNLVVVVVPSDDMSLKFIKIGVRKKNIKIIANAFNPLFFVDIKKDRKFAFTANLLNGLNCPLFANAIIHNKSKFFDKKKSRPKIIGTVSRLSPEKGLDDLIIAASKLIKIRQDLVFLVVGSGSEKERLDEKIKKLGLNSNFFLLGYRDYKYVSYFLDLIDVFVLPSSYESFGLSVLEAFYFKAPVVAVRNGGIKSIITQGQDGLLFTPHNTNDLAKNIEYLVNHPIQGRLMADNAYQLLQKKFSIKEIGQKWEKYLV